MALTGRGPRKSGGGATWRRSAPRGETIATVGAASLIFICALVLMLGSGGVGKEPDAVAANGQPSSVATAGESPRVADRRTDKPTEPGHIAQGEPADGNTEEIDRLVCKTATKSTSFTALSYNIKSARAGSLSTLLGAVRRSGAEVVLLQEVDDKRRKTGDVDQPAWFASQLGGWHYYFGRNVRFGDGDYGTALISKFPIVSATNTLLPNSGNLQQRGLLHAVIEVEGIEVSVYNTHLTNINSSVRARQAAAVAGIVGPDPRAKILGGDMNAGPGSASINNLLGPMNDSWSAGSGGGGTVPVSRPRARIDFLMHAGPDLSPTRSDVMGDRGSDHLGVRTTYELGGIRTKKCRLG